MRLLYQLTSPMHRTLGTREIERRRGFVQECASAGTEVEVRPIERGPASINTAADAALVVPELLEALSPGRTSGFDAVVVGCFGDPGLDAVREVCDVPAIGPGASAFHLAAQLGGRFSILTPGPRSGTRILARLSALGLAGLFVSARSAGCSVMDLAQQKEGSFDSIVESGRACARDGAEILVMGCMSMAFMPGIHQRLRDATGIPVVNPVIAAVRTAEAAAALSLNTVEKTVSLQRRTVAS